MKVLVTGATGFIGSFLAEALAAKGYQVTCLVRRTSDRRWLHSFDHEILVADITDRASYASDIRDFDYIFHAAGVTKAGSAAEFLRENADGTRELARTAGAQGGLKRFIYVSSLAAAGPSPDGRPLDEGTAPHPVSAYGRSKLAGEEAVSACSGSMPVTIIRPSAVYGPRDRDFLLVFRAAQSGIFPYWGRSTYSLIHVQDLVRGMILAAEAPAAAGKTFYLADPRSYSTDDIQDALSTALGRRSFRMRLPRSVLGPLAAVIQKMNKKGIINADKMRELGFPHWNCSPARAHQAFGFMSEMTLGEGFMKTACWYRNEQWL